MSCQISGNDSQRPAQSRAGDNFEMPASAYFHSDAYHAALDSLEAIARNFDPDAPDDLRTKIIEAIGDLGIWPMTAFTGMDEGKVIVVA